MPSSPAALQGRYYGAPSGPAGSSSRAVSSSVPGRPSRASSRTRTRSSIYSPELPTHPHRQRLSLRSPSIRGASENPGQRNHLNDGDDDDLVDDFAGDNADALNEVILAIDMKENGNLGCAYYIAADEILFLLEDVPMASIEIVETVILHATPTTILIPSRTSQAVVDMLAKGAHSLDEHGRHGKMWTYL